jgi:glucose dehydrogenase
MRSRRLGFWIGLLLCAHGASAQSPPPASDHAIVEWPVYGGNLASQFYSPLDQINVRNVKDLKVAWRWSGGNFGPTP